MKICDISINEDGIVLFNGKLCVSGDEAYRMFRAKYNAMLGRAGSRRLGRGGQRIERVNGYGIVFDDRKQEYLSSMFDGFDKVSAYMLGLVGICYCRGFGCNDFADIPDEYMDDYLDWVMSSEHNLRMLGRKGTPNTRNTYNTR